MINLLDIYVANLIAAGEVVDRPSSALKELVENSVDAGASIITIEIKGGGISYIRVTDNGEGMNAEDLGRAILRHATSKIKNEEDLAKITTLGFRGEALAAISSVSDMKIFTKTRESQSGYMLESSSGLNTKISEAGCANGTTVVIEKLFSKIPARQKFLKRDMTEGMYCKWITEKIALSNPFVSFKFIQDGKQKLFTPGNGNYKDTVYSVFGEEIADNLISVGDFNNVGDGVLEVPKDEENIKVYGFVSRIENGQKTRVNENFFVNGRYVYSKTVMSALEEAYKSVSETKTFPVCALYIKVDESKVDINVHPQKMEIKFSDEKSIYSAVYYAVKESLNNSGDLNNNFVFAKPPENPENSENQIIENKSVAIPKNQINIITEIKGEKETTENNNTSKYFDFSDKSQNSKNQNNQKIENIETLDIETEYNISEKIYSYKDKENAENKKSIENNENIEIVNNNYSKNNYKILGEAFYGYIFIEKDEKIIIIDKHAAHERIIYDIILKKAVESNINSEFKSQILLVPVEVKLTPKEAAGIIDIEPDIKKLGIIFEWRGDDKILITEIPPEIYDSNVNIEEIIKEAAYLNTEGNFAADKTIFENLVMISAKKSAACRAAMKSGISDNIENIAWLVDKVINYENVKYCPHGRPVAFEITKNEIEKQFKR
ncbi:MAG: DNA mismatch repair endonuclease MutL [Oscillospiraceae bacterium]|nr:DNA mismatch repair endonuclease MutL [Oscillospiraceae bacterium]